MTCQIFNYYFNFRHNINILPKTKVLIIFVKYYVYIDYLQISDLINNLPSRINKLYLLTDTKTTTQNSKDYHAILNLPHGCELIIKDIRKYIKDSIYWWQIDETIKKLYLSDQL